MVHFLIYSSFGSENRSLNLACIFSISLALGWPAVATIAGSYDLSLCTYLIMEVIGAISGLIGIGKALAAIPATIKVVLKAKQELKELLLEVNFQKNFCFSIPNSSHQLQSLLAIYEKISILSRAYLT
jgi:hypothetical protein